MKKPPGLKNAFLVHLGFVIFLLFSCNYYRPVTSFPDENENLLNATILRLYPKSIYPREQYPMMNLQKLFIMDYKIFIVESDSIWFLSEVSISNDSVIASARLIQGWEDKYSEILKSNKSTRYIKSQDPDQLKNVFIYPGLVDIISNDQVSLSSEDISRITLFRDDPSQKAGGLVVVIGGLIALSVGLIIWASLN